MAKIIISILLLLSLKSSAQVDLWHMHNYTAPVGGGPILDTYTGAGRAFSIRKLRTAYAGFCMEINRSSDNAKLDVGFTANGDLDTAAMKTFIGANTAYVTKWYDQTTNLDVAISTSNTNAPRIINAGVIDRQGAWPTLVFVPASQPRLDFSASGGVSISGDYSLYMVSKRRVTSVVGPVISNNGPVPTQLFGHFNDNNLYISRPSFIRSAADATAIFNLLEGYKISNVLTAYKNTAAYTLGTEVAGNGSAIFSRIGRYGETGSFFSDGNISEVIIYPSSQSSNRIAIASNLNTYYTIY